jgi:hypothetical protein
VLTRNEIKMSKTGTIRGGKRDRVAPESQIVQERLGGFFALLL